jgi:hypothetical protein
MATLHFTKGESEAAKSLGLTVPEIVTVKAENGDLLYGAIYRPPADQFGTSERPDLRHSSCPIPKPRAGAVPDVHQRQQFSFSR